jgi:signal transduction histidine kinase
VTEEGNRRTAVPPSLAGLRLRLTAWYVGTFLTILLLLGIGLFAVITRRFDSDLDASLIIDTEQIETFASTRDAAEASRDVRIPERTLYVVDSLGEAFDATPVPRWITLLARDAWRSGQKLVDGQHAEGDRVLRAFARSVREQRDGPFVAIAIADEIELEDRYATLIAEFGTAAFIAVVLVAVGGWIVTRQSTAPIERSMEHMRRFMADAAHELRTPITVVRSRAEVALQRSRSAEEYAIALRGIDGEAQRLGHIVEDLLMLARADTGERPIERERVFLDDVALDAAEAARAIAHRKSIRVEVDSFEEAPVVGDSALLRQLVLILLDNAIKYTPTGGSVHMNVQTRDGSALLSVLDTGIGIPAEHVAHVFERFYRGDPARTRAAANEGTGVSSEGAGLGLSIAYWIVSEHQGSIRIESKPDEGTLIEVRLPSTAKEPPSPS